MTIDVLELEEENKRLQDELNEALNKIDELEEKCADLEDDISDKDDDISAMKFDIDDLKDELKQSESFRNMELENCRSCNYESTCTIWQAVKGTVPLWTNLSCDDYA